MPLERTVRLTGRGLEVIAEFGFPVHVLTKSDLVLRDLELVIVINRTCAVVSFTITTANDDLARQVEPGAPSPSARFRAMATLAEHGIATGVLLTPLGVLVFALSLLLLALLVQLLPLTVLRLVLVTVGGPFRFGLTASCALLGASLLTQGDPSRIFLLAPPPSLPALAA